MNILPSTATEPLPPGPQRAPAEVTPVRPLRNLDPRQAGRAGKGPQGSPTQQEDAIDRLRRAAEPDTPLPLRGRRAVAAYTSLDRADEQSHMRQVLGFEFQI